MGQRGKKSGAELSVIGSNVSAIHRLDAPSYLTREQAEVWVTVVNQMPAEWLQAESEKLLAQYCRHSVLAERAWGLIEEYESSDSFSINKYNQLLIMHEREGRALSSLATRLMLTPQSTTPNRRKSKDPKPKRPWEK